MSTTLESPPQKEVLDALENLIEVNRDGQEGYRQAAEYAFAAELKELFREYATERSGMVGDLQNLQRQHGKIDVDDSGTIVGSLHRAWINLRSAVASNNDQALLEEAERGEDVTLKSYREALQPSGAPLPRSVTSVLEKHLGKVLASHKDIRDRRDSGRYRKA